ncbi:mechanosensitive ion channel family protein [Thalassoroseus pseudoceratinae]|uniref:mechanosensitive ion channel family protein n=1 Tax=Thalassoroseus pseudoceratinae TaxID=2713176 RepID=UPI00141ECA3F|nr:mechanosensitive ion channel family protein [Thalassoroseus pseudoceratinae]
MDKDSMWYSLNQFWHETVVDFVDRILPEGQLLNSTAHQWATAIAIFVAGFMFLPAIKGIIRLRVKAIADRRDENCWSHGLVKMVAATRFWFLVMLSLFLATLALSLPRRGVEFNRSAIIVALVLQAAIWMNALIKFGMERYIKLRAEDASAITTAKAIAFLVRCALWAVALLMVLSNLGVDVTTLVASLGVGGIAVALAAQNILGDLFASLSIVMDKPFVLGDFIIVGDMMGTVQHIGLKTTRVQSLSGEQLVFPNSDLLSSRIRNFKRMQERRIVFTIGVTYQTPSEQVKAIPDMLKTAVEAQNDVRFDRAHFKSYGDSALLYETVYYVMKPDYNLYMDIQQKINYHLLDKFTDENIEFAYPTQTVFAEVVTQPPNTD